MIGNFEAELTEPLKETSNTENLAVAEEGNVVESITAEAKASNEMESDLKYKKKMEAYEEKMKSYIENIISFEKKNKVYTTQWRTIYEGIEPEFLINLTFSR